MTADANNQSSARASGRAPGRENSTRRDHYEILGVARTAPHSEVRRAYLARARRWHPDGFSGAPVAEAEKAERAMRRVNQAWEVLGDPDRRQAYDRQLVPGVRTVDDARAGIRTDDGVTRIDPRLLDPAFLTARREAQLTDISNRTSLVLRAAPLLAVLGLLVAIFVFTAYARDSVGTATPSTVPGPNLGAGIAANDCVTITSGPALLEVPCTAAAAGRVIGAYLAGGGGSCPIGTDREQELSNRTVVCLDAVR